MTRRTSLQLLRSALDEIYVVASECELDRLSHGPNPRKNKATSSNDTRLITLGQEVLELLPYARAEVDANPTAANQRQLAKCERELSRWVRRFEPSLFPDEPPTTH
jgi:hypothetical protein